MVFHHLLVPSDGSELSTRAVQQAIALASSLGARITFMHVQSSFPISLVGAGELVDPHTVEALVAAARDGAERILAAAGSAAAAAGVPWDQLTLVAARPATAIVEAAGKQGADLIVMASHGRRGVEGVLLGSETQRVLSHSRCPVLVVR